LQVVSVLGVVREVVHAAALAAPLPRSRASRQADGGNGRIALADDQQLVAELLRIRTSADGGSIVKRRVGDSHCDLADAVLGAVAALDSAGAGSGSVLPMAGWAEGGLELDDKGGRIAAFAYDAGL
jgi:hypothetical protein